MAEKTVKLPSGLEVKIRRPGLKTIADARRYGAQEGGEDESLRELYSLAWVVSRAAVEPRISLDQPKNGEVWIDDLPPRDILHLGREVIEFAGLDQVEESVAPLSGTGK